MERICPFEDNKLHVLCCASALANNGLIYFDKDYPITYTTFKNLHNKDFGLSKFVYNPNIDFTNYVRVHSKAERILIPTKERALVESIIFIDCIDEGLLIEGLKNYIDYFYNEKELYKVCDFYKLSRETLDYWLNEAREYDMEG